MAVIQWFPGHMAKARREISEYIKLVDIVFELRDARIPFSSKNPMIDEIVGTKPRLILLCKASMADPKVTKMWIDYYKSKGIYSLDIDSMTRYNLKAIIPTMKNVLAPMIEKKQAKGLKCLTFKAMIVGIPNVGKSTLINTMAGKKSLNVGNKPGVTKSQTWMRVTDELLLLDTPGILWPKFEDQTVGMNLAICGSIKDEILNLEEITFGAMNKVVENYPHLLKNRYGIEIDENDTPEDVLTKIGVKRNCYAKGGVIDYEKVLNFFMYDVRNNKLGAMSFEKPDRECESI